MVVTSDVLGVSLVNDESNIYRAAQSTPMIDFKTQRSTSHHTNTNSMFKIQIQIQIQKEIQTQIQMNEEASI